MEVSEIRALLWHSTTIGLHDIRSDQTQQFLKFQFQNLTSFSEDNGENIPPTMLELHYGADISLTKQAHHQKLEERIFKTNYKIPRLDFQVQRAVDSLIVQLARYVPFPPFEGGG
jgi:hypothetical protein